MRWFIACGVACGAMLAAGTAARAQFGTTNQSTMFGSRTLGGATTAGNRTFTGTNSGSSALGSSSTSGLGGSSFGTGTSGRSGSSTFGATGTGGTGMLNANDRFVRGSRQPGQFVGSDTQDFRSILGGVSSGTNQNFNTRSTSGTAGTAGLAGMQQRGRTGQPGTGQPASVQPGARGARGARGGALGDQLPVTVSLGFDESPPGAETVSAVLSDRLTRSKRIQRVSPIQVALSDGTAILRGEVASQHDRALAEQLALLEPGVRSVRNELAVQSAAPPQAPLLLPGLAPGTPGLP